MQSEDLDPPPAVARHFALATGRLSVLGVDNAYATIPGWNT
jgi:hypothetical protein